MRRTLLILSPLSLLAIVTTAVFTDALPPGAYITFNLPAQIVLFLAPATIEALVVAVSVVALVATAQRRQWGWFTSIFILLLVSVYGSYLVFFVLPSVGLDDVSSDLVTGIMLAPAPLATFVYSLGLTESEPHTA